MHKYSLATIKLALQAYQSSNNRLHTQQDADRQAVSAAVLMLLVEAEAGISCVFIERAENPRDLHSGQIAFPGGKTEEHDHDYIATAIREAQEEIGIRVKRDDIMGLLPLQTSRKQYPVRPVIACINWPQQLILQKEEVANVFTLPLSWLADKKNVDSATVMGLPEQATIVYKEYNNRRLWGLTAKIIDDFLQIISTH